MEVTVALEKAGYTVVRTDDTRDGLRQLYSAYPDLVILTKELAMENGENPCLRVRQACYLPIIVLGKEDNASEMLELGDDAELIFTVAYRYTTHIYSYLPIFKHNLTKLHQYNIIRKSLAKSGDVETTSISGYLGRGERIVKPTFMWKA